MNNKNKILVGCLALLLTLSVGYALFSDTITINGTATAKGNFDIITTCESGIPSKLGTAESLGLYAEGGYQNDTCSVADDAVSLSTDLLYPGARRNFTVKFTNNGSIDAILKRENVSDTEELCVADNMNGENKECKTQSNANSSLSINDYTGNMPFSFIAAEDPDGNILTTQNEIAEFTDSAYSYFILKPGYSIYYYHTLYFGHRTNATYEGKEFFAEYNATITYLFEQTAN